MKEWPQPNIEYIISIQNLTNVLGDALVSGVRRKIIFVSSITSKVQITYPAFNEVITDLKLKWQETAVDPNQPLVNSYYIEISTEANFYNIVKKTEVQDRTEIDLTDVTKKQYYVRVRAQKDGEYGSWSDVVTFVVGDSADVPGPIFDDGDSSVNEEPIFSADMQIVSAPANGETPASFIIEFDCEVDPDSIEDIIVLRRRI
jgi:biopolymer transport protein ExbD